MQKSVNGSAITFCTLQKVSELSVSNKITNYNINFILFHRHRSFALVFISENRKRIGTFFNLLKIASNNCQNVQHNQLPAGLNSSLLRFFIRLV